MSDVERPERSHVFRMLKARWKPFSIIRRQGHQYIELFLQAWAHPAALL
jgi:hypothetical protein